MMHAYDPIMTKTEDYRFEIKSWDEKPYLELEDGRKLTRASVVLAGTADALASATFESLMYYASDGTSTYTSFMHITGTLDGRSGSIVLQGQGTYDGTTARGESVIVDATGDLAGITGKATSASTHADYPYMPLTLTYEFA